MGAFRNMGLMGRLIETLKNKKQGAAPMGLAGAVVGAMQKKKGVATPQGGSPLGISRSGNLAGGLQASQGGSPLGKVLT